eukprot:4525646-Amphidinium_carterae.1
MSLQEWYDDDNMDYDANELKDECVHKSTSERLHSTTTEGRDSDEVGNTITTRRYEEETESTIRCEGIHTKSQHRRDRSYASSYHIAQLNNHEIYMSNIASAFLNTPVPPESTIL